MKLTKVEKIILKNTDKMFKYIARDESGGLFLYAKKPIKDKEHGSWDGVPYCYMRAFFHLFQDIKWEDEEPCKFR